MAHKTLAHVTLKKKRHRKRVGAFLRRRREKLGLVQDDLIRILGFKNKASISQVEMGNEGLPLKHVYPLADALGLSRDAFLKFVLGEVGESRLTAPKRKLQKGRPGPVLSGMERELVRSFRRLTKEHRRRVIETVGKLSATSPRLSPYRLPTIRNARASVRRL